ncbi:MAG TPA: hypothetical protein VHV54_20615, partial [Candidatus Binatia bacterium]|nr:hypothetical protein [Candidatus Binatia bacterium]
MKRIKFCRCVSLVLLAMAMCWLQASAASGQTPKLDPKKEQAVSSGAATQTKATDGDTATNKETSRSDDEKNSPPAAALPDKAQITGLRFLSSKSYTRIMLDLSQEANFEVRRLK